MAKLLTTAEAAAATGLSEYELRKGEKEGRYPAIWIGGRNARSGKMRWNLEFLNTAIIRQMMEQHSDNNW